MKNEVTNGGLLGILNTPKFGEGGVPKEEVKPVKPKVPKKDKSFGKKQAEGFNKWKAGRKSRTELGPR